MERDTACKWKPEAGVATVTSDKIHFKPKTVTRDTEGHYVIIKKDTSKWRDSSN